MINLPSTTPLIRSLQPVSLSQPRPDAWPRNVCAQQRRSFWTWGLSGPPRVPGLPPYTWSLRSQVIGDFVGTTDVSTKPRYPTDIPSPICMTSPHPWKVPPFSQSWTWSERITRYQWLTQTSQKLPLQHLLGSMSSPGCPLDSRTLPRPSKGSWMKSSEV